MTGPPIDWNALSGKHSPDLVQEVRKLVSGGGPFEISPEMLASTGDNTVRQAESLLSCLCPPLKRIRISECPNCGFELSDEAPEPDVCPSCSRPYADYGGAHRSDRFAYQAERSRDVPWVLALHGMNTRGEWQEQFSWRVSTTYGRSVPFAIYKYGWVTAGAVWAPSLRRQVKRLLRRVRALRGDAEQGGFTGPPDVIAHSLGTWLIGHALLADPSLRVGRIVLTGSILRPDFDWAKLIERGQVEAVLNHFGTRDCWAWLAHYVIPDSGPSGRRGFSGQACVVQVPEKRFGHSDFFLESNLSKAFSEVWRPFLTSSHPQPSLVTAISGWTQSAWPCRATLIPLILLALSASALAVLVCSLVVGLYELGRLLLKI